MSYKIEQRELNILGFGGHYFWVLYNDKGNIIGELHGLATNRTTGERQEVGTNADQLKVWDFSSKIAEGVSPTELGGLSGYYEEAQSSIIKFDGDNAIAMAKWRLMENAGKQIDTNNITYDLFGGETGIITMANSNSVAKTLGDVADLPISNVSWYTDNPGDEKNLLPLTTYPNLYGADKLVGSTASNNAINAFTQINTNTRSISETPVSSDNSTLIDNGVTTVKGVGNVNTNSGVTAVFNDIISDSYRPGNQNLSPNDAVMNSVLGFANVGIDLFANAINNVMNAFTQLIPTDPLLLDLNGDGVKLTDYAASPVLFDIDHDGGSKEQTGWVSSQDGIVVYDLNNNGKIDGIHETLSEYFNGTVGSNGTAGEKKYANGFAALKSLDSNNDNQFTNTDTTWNNIKVWTDANHDGITDVGELKTLTELGITSINLNSTSQSGLVRDGNEILASGTFVQNGQSKEALAANFIANPNGSSFTISGTGLLTTTEGNLKSYTAGDGGETIDVAQKQVNNAVGGAGNDTLIGDASNNWLTGGSGADSFNAGAGDDVLLIDNQDTQIDGGDGNDIAQVVGDLGVALNLAQSHIEAAIGGRGNDILIGGGVSSVFIRAGAGDDIVIGSAANDALSGERVGRNSDSVLRRMKAVSFVSSYFL